MLPLLFTILFSILGSVLSLSLAALFLFASPASRTYLLPALVSFAAGTLLGAAFIGMLPKAQHLSGAPDRILIFVLLGIVLFLVLEKLVVWRHCHTPGCKTHTATGPLILIGDALHNLIDGIVIAGSFHVSIPSGIAASIAIIAHEVPQEIGDFALLLDYGYSRKKAFLLNLLSSATTLLGGLVAFFALANMRFIIPYVLAISAASFIYIALADILPGLNRKFSQVGAVIQIFLLLAGMGTIALVKMITN